MGRPHTWPDDPSTYWTNDANPVDEPAVSPEIPDNVPRPSWPTPLTGADLYWSEDEGTLAEEDPEGEASWSHKVDLDSTEGNDAEEDALDAPDPLSPIAEGAPPGEEADTQPNEPDVDPDDGDGGMGGEVLSVAARVARGALSRRPEAPLAKPPAPPWRDGSRPPREPAHPQQGGSRHREAPLPPWEATQASGRNPWGNRGAQQARMGPSSSSTAGGPDAPPAYLALGSSDDQIRARLAEALRLAEEARVKAEPAQAELARLAAEAHTEPLASTGTSPASRDSARDRSRSARAHQKAERVKPTLTARAMTPSAVPAPPWPPSLPKPPPVAAPPSIPKAKPPPGKARQHPIGAPQPQAPAPEEEYEIVEDVTPPVSPKAKLRPAPAKQPPIGAPPPPVPDLELDPGAPSVGVHYVPSHKVAHSPRPSGRGRRHLCSSGNRHG